VRNHSSFYFLGGIGLNDQHTLIENKIKEKLSKKGKLTSLAGIPDELIKKYHTAFNWQAIYSSSTFTKEMFVKHYKYIFQAGNRTKNVYKVGTAYCGRGIISHNGDISKENYVYVNVGFFNTRFLSKVSNKKNFLMDPEVIQVINNVYKWVVGKEEEHDDILSKNTLIYKYYGRFIFEDALTQFMFRVADYEILKKYKEIIDITSIINYRPSLITLDYIKEYGIDSINYYRPGSSKYILNVLQQEPGLLEATFMTSKGYHFKEDCIEQKLLSSEIISSMIKNESNIDVKRGLTLAFVKSFSLSFDELLKYGIDSDTLTASYILKNFDLDIDQLMEFLPRLISEKYYSDNVLALKDIKRETLYKILDPSVALLLALS
jgi:hypothetical protein